MNLLLPRICILPQLFVTFMLNHHNWYKGNKSTASRSKLEIMTTHYGLIQIINKSTNILEDSSSCLDIVFTSQSRMIRDSGYHQIVLAKFDLNVFYSPCYK